MISLERCVKEQNLEEVTDLNFFLMIKKSKQKKICGFSLCV